MLKYNWKNKEKFLNDWKSSKNICVFLKSQGLTFTSGNYKTFKKWYAIHVEDFEAKNTIQLGNIFTQNSCLSGHALKKRIKNLNILEYKCAVCKNNGFWNDKELVLQLEHKNGINNDHRIENLEYLCPNCHSQTTSFTGSNIHNKIFEYRLNTLVDFDIGIVDKNNIEKLSKNWGIKNYSALRWLRQYELKLNKESIFLDDSLKLFKKTNNKINSTLDEVEKYLYINNSDKSLMKINDIQKVLKTENPIKILSEYWSMSKQSTKRSIRKLNLANLHEDFKINNVKVIDTEKRKEIVVTLINKKQVPKIAKDFGISSNGLKKWIKINLPEKFKEIYDDDLLVKNINKVKKREREFYIQSLNHKFLEEEAMAYLKTNKSGIYSLIKKYNPKLFTVLQSEHLCPKCNSFSRSSGKKRRCINCSHEF